MRSWLLRCSFMPLAGTGRLTALLDAQVRHFKALLAQALEPKCAASIRKITGQGMLRSAARDVLGM